MRSVFSSIFNRFLLMIVMAFRYFLHESFIGSFFFPFVLYTTFHGVLKLLTTKNVFKVLYGSLTSLSFNGTKLKIEQFS